MFAHFWGAKAPEATIPTERVVKNTKIDLPVGTHTVNVICEWDPRVACDVDLSAVMFGAGKDETRWVDIANRHAPGCRHGGDNNHGGLMASSEEAVAFTLPELPAEVQEAYVCIVCSDKKATPVNLDRAPGLRMWLKSPQVERMFRVEAPGASGYVFGRFRRLGADQWQFELLGPSRPGCVKWQDLKPEIAKFRPNYQSPAPPKPAEPKKPVEPKPVPKKEEPPLPPPQPVPVPVPVLAPPPGPAFKAETLDLPSTCRSLQVGCGFDSKDDVDLDLSGIVFDARDEIICKVDYKDNAAPGMRHSGDETAGKASGDDECISIDLSALPADAEQVFFCLTVFTEGVMFDRLRNLRCHLVWPGLDRYYPVAPAGSKNGFVFGRLGRLGPGWYFQTFGTSRGDCISWPDLKDEMRKLRGMHPVVQPAPQVPLKHVPTYEHREEIPAHVRRASYVTPHPLQPRPTLREETPAVTPRSPLYVPPLPPKPALEFKEAIPPHVRRASYATPPPAASPRFVIPAASPRLSAASPRLSFAPPLPSRPKVEFKEEVLGLPDGCRNLDVGCGWDALAGKDLDLDFSAIMYGAGGNLIHKVDYRDKAAPGMLHSGDDRSGNASGDDECISVNLSAVPEEAQEIFFCLTIFTQGVDFDEIRNLHCHVVWPGLDKTYPVAAAGNKNGFVFGRLSRSGPTWSFQTFGTSRGNCISWVDLKDEMKRLRGAHPVAQPAPPVLRSVYVPKLDFKEEILELPGGCRNLDVGCGWDPIAGKDLDIDFSAIMYGAGGNEIHKVDYRDKMAPGMLHSGDERSGQAHGDDECISINLSAVPEEVQEIFFCLTVFTQGVTFDRIRNLHCHLVWPGLDKTYPVAPAGSKNGFVFGRLGKVGNKWSFQTFGASHANCISWVDLKDEMRKLQAMYPIVQPRRVWHPVKVAVPRGENAVQVGCGWDFAGQVDVDMSGIMFDGSGEQPLYAVDYKSKSCPGAVHSGDNLDGKVDGDDEVITVTLSEVPLSVETILFTATIFTEGVYFDNLENIFFHLRFGGREVGKYPVYETGRKNGYIFGMLRRTPDGWEFASVNASREGCMSWTDLKGDISRARFGSKRAGDTYDSPLQKRMRTFEGSAFPTHQVTTAFAGSPVGRLSTGARSYTDVSPHRFSMGTVGFAQAAPVHRFSLGTQVYGEATAMPGLPMTTRRYSTGTF